MKDRHNDFVFKPSVAPQVATDDTALTGTVIDLAGYRACEFVVQTGTLADANATFDVQLQHGDAANGGDCAECAATDQIGADVDFDYSADGKIKRVGYCGAKRYVRIVVTPSGNSGNVPISACVMLEPMKKPEAQA